jgi:signal transduction histidine kinase
LQRKVLLTVSALVVLPMLVAGWLAAEWVSDSFERRLAQWISDAARASQNWLQAYQSDAVMLGRVLAEDPRFVAAIEARTTAVEEMPTPVRRIAQELGIQLVQLYTPQQKLVYSSIPIEVQSHWERGQTEAVLKVLRGNKSMLAAVGITPLPRTGTPHYYLVLGSLIGQDFTEELAQLTGLTARLYYREGRQYYDIFTRHARSAALALPEGVLRRLEKDKKPYYSLYAEGGRFRGLYSPLVDSTGRVEAIMFLGLERRGPQEVLTNRVALFLAIAVIGLVIGALVGLTLSRRVLRPVALLRAGVMQLASQDFEARIPIASNDELGDLARAFNAMAERLRVARDEQAQRFRRDKLAAIGELSAALAHEIRNPIGVINASAALLEKSNDEARRRELLRMIREEGQRVAGLVQDFLQLSRHRAPVPAPIDPAAPLERALELALAAGGGGLRVHRRYGHDGARILADGAQLAQAWSNLVANAREALAGSADGTLWVETELSDRRVVLALEDSGPGIPPEILPRVFEPFFTTKENGTGLGLSIAYSLVEANGGRLEAAAPRHGGGARFVMQFPIHAERSSP